MSDKNKSLQARKRLGDLMAKVRTDVGDNAVDRQLQQTALIRPSVQCHVMFLLDVSGSMASNDKLPSSKAGLLGFAADLPSPHGTGLITFSDSARLVRGLASEPLADAVAQVFAQGGTVLAGAIGLARQQLGSITTGRRIVVLVTDGCPADRGAAYTEAERTRKAGIEILAIATADADKAYLDSLVSAQEFTVSVENDDLQIGFERAARLLRLPKL